MPPKAPDLDNIREIPTGTRIDLSTVDPGRLVQVRVDLPPEGDTPSRRVSYWLVRTDESYVTGGLVTQIVVQSDAPVVRPMFSPVYLSAVGPLTLSAVITAGQPWEAAPKGNVVFGVS